MAHGRHSQLPPETPAEAVDRTADYLGMALSRSGNLAFKFAGSNILRTACMSGFVSGQGRDIVELSAALARKTCDEQGFRPLDTESAVPLAETFERRAVRDFADALEAQMRASADGYAPTFITKIKKQFGVL